ncbi:MAG: folate family ECF transporter S component [Clostridia bacterium]|nr:folate family ECF transporter S component [Clostridia bacterium]
MKKNLLPLKVVAAMAMLSAISIVAGKYLAIPGGDVMRFSFENLPIILAGAAFGPLAGTLVGAVADLVGCVLVGYAINPLVTLGATSIGAVSGLVYLLLKKVRLPIFPRVIISVFSAHLIGSVVIKTIGLAAFYSIPFHILILWRALNYLIVGSVECFIVFVILKNKMVSAQIASLNKGRRKQKGEKRMTYGEALEYIHGINGTFCKPGLERITELCEALGNPQRELKFIHVAGTNGKGSTSSMLSEVLIHAGYWVGLYTSPYIYRFNERIKVMGEDISDGELCELCERLKPITDKMTDKPTEFELITAIAFEHFKRCGCEVVVLEVGMGGRFDSTNIIRDPLLSIITGISLDHTAFLGDTTEKIAFEKAGIIKDGAPVIFGGEDEGALRVIEEVCCERGSRLYRPSYSEIKNGHTSLEGASFDYKNYKNVKLSLLGEYQLRNAAVVLEAVEVLREEGLKINTGAALDGIFTARWRARFEIIHREPTVIFDGAHNAEGILAACESIKKYYPEGGVAVMTGVLADKDYKAIAKCISSVAGAVFTITPDNPRALSAEEYAEVLSSLGAVATACGCIKDALGAGMEYAREHGVPMFCLGSLYTYSAVIDALDSN